MSSGAEMLLFLKPLAVALVRLYVGRRGFGFQISDFRFRIVRTGG
jgi:hypothetical protein